MPEWRRVEPGPCTCHWPPMQHNRWEITNPVGDGKNRLVTDAVIRTYGRKHVEKLLAKTPGLPPLPEQAWLADRYAHPEES
jgi:hypothetical protein